MNVVLWEGTHNRVCMLFLLNYGKEPIEYLPCNTNIEDKRIIEKYHWFLQYVE